MKGLSRKRQPLLLFRVSVMCVQLNSDQLLPVNALLAMERRYGAKSLKDASAPGSVCQSDGSWPS